MVGCDCRWFPARPVSNRSYYSLTHGLRMPLCLALEPLAGSVFIRRRLLPREPRRSRPHALGPDILTLGGLPCGLRRNLLDGGTLTSRRRASLR